jgi:hypothetical protein
MLSRTIDLLKNKIVPYGLIFFVVYLILTSWIFAFRHPWATDMERLIHIGDALMFKKVSYSDMRGNYEK